MSAAMGGSSSSERARGGPRWIGLLVFGPAIGWLLLAAAGVWVTHEDADAWGPIDRRDSNVEGSGSCRRCHAAQYETWHRTYHRTMTQVAEGSAVLAPFEGESVDVLGFRATMDRAPSGRPRMRIRAIDDPAAVALVDAEVELTVGSHRYQQYVARLDTGAGPLERWRLPMAWHVAQQRWIHLGGAFLVPDGTHGDAAHVLRFMSRWNDNCIFCHNTEPVPGLDPDGALRSEVGELGIACEACHGPASAHVQRHAAPLRRLLAGLSRRSGDPSVAHPGRLDAGRHSQVCGRCHGQRIGHDLAEVMATGDGFLPGTDLATVSRPIFRDTRLASDPPQARPFAERFWPDGTPRLSAYEYQALLLSACHQDGEGLGCGDCHSMHGTDPNMQLHDDYDERRVCSGCHPSSSLSGANLERGHGGHAQAVSCGGCHMPRITYGLLEGMITHRIGSPDPGALVGRDDQPDACTQCHVDRSRAWAAASMPTLGLRTTSGGEPRPHEAWASRVELDLVGGDPIARALAAHAMGRPEAAGAEAARMAALVDALEDEIAVVRWLAARAMGRLARGRNDHQTEALLGELDVLGDPVHRVELAARLRAHLGSGPFGQEPDRLEQLQRWRDDRAIEIGE
jgi:predicted CXXCH cytochrome family protein